MVYGLYIIILFVSIHVYCYPVPIPDKMIIVGDKNVVDYVRNFYKEVILEYDVPNFKMVVWNPSSYGIFEKYGIPVDYAPVEVNDKYASLILNSQDFTKKINDRCRIIYEYLKQNLTVMSLDADLYFFENPLNILNHINPDDDITYSLDFYEGDHVIVNVGLIYIRPTTKTLQLFDKILKILKISQSDFFFIEQGITNLVLLSKRIKGLKYGILDMLVFTNGYFYYQLCKRYVDDKCSFTPIGFHNNYVIGGIPKIYRYKEWGLWKIDDNEYYTSKTRKYIKYSTDITPEIGYEKSMIYLMYLGKELNRTIIFPRFNTMKNNETYFTQFIHYWNLGYFEEKYGIDYRENISFFIIILTFIYCFFNILSIFII